MECIHIPQFSNSHVWWMQWTRDIHFILHNLGLANIPFHTLSITSQTNLSFYCHVSSSEIVFQVNVLLSLFVSIQLYYEIICEHQIVYIFIQILVLIWGPSIYTFVIISIITKLNHSLFCSTVSASVADQAKFFFISLCNRFRHLLIDMILIVLLFLPLHSLSKCHKLVYADIVCPIIIMIYFSFLLLNLS